MAAQAAALLALAGLLATTLPAPAPTHVAAASGAAQVIDVTDCMWDADALYDGATGDGFSGIDLNAFYGMMHPSANIPGGHFRFEGEFPRARYFGFQSYAAIQLATDVLPDHLMAPLPGSANPFAGAPWEAEKVSYAFDLLPVPPWEREDPHPGDVLYGGYDDQGVPQVRDTIEFRIYVPDRSDVNISWPPTRDDIVNGTFPGGVKLPRVLYVIDDPLLAAVMDHDLVCRLNQTGVTYGATAFLDRQLFGPLGPLLYESGLPPSPALNPPLWIAAAGDWSPYPLLNQETGYLLTFVDKLYGDVFAMRFRVPVFEDSEAGERIDGDKQVRYWSICGIQWINFWNTTGCIRDHGLALEAGNYATIALSDPEDRPANAAHWLAYPGGQSFLFIREIVPDPETFPESALFLGLEGQVPSLPPEVPGHLDEPLREHQGEYYPGGVYCSKAQFEEDECRSVQQPSHLPLPATPAE